MQVRWRNNEQKLTLKPPRSLNGEFNTTVSQAQLDKPKLEMGRKHIEDTFKRVWGGAGEGEGGDIFWKDETEMLVWKYDDWI